MILIYRLLAGITNHFSQAELWLVVWVVVLVGFSAWTFSKARTRKKSRFWVVRKGECPFCGHRLFATTGDYRRLYLLDTVSFESRYLCTGCDREKIAGLLSTLRGSRETDLGRS
jgi:hypothetical protein